MKTKENSIKRAIRILGFVSIGMTMTFQAYAQDYNDSSASDDGSSGGDSSPSDGGATTQPGPSVSCDVCNTHLAAAMANYGSEGNRLSQDLDWANLNPIFWMTTALSAAAAYCTEWQQCLDYQQCNPDSPLPFSNEHFDPLSSCNEAFNIYNSDISIYLTFLGIYYDAKDFWDANNCGTCGAFPNLPANLDQGISSSGCQPPPAPAQCSDDNFFGSSSSN